MKHTKKILSIAILSLVATAMCAQGGMRWKRTRYELIGGLVVTNFMGDLGGGARTNSKIGKYLGDFDFSATRPGLYFGMRYRIAPAFSLKGNIYAAVLKGDDKYSDAPDRVLRNLNFWSPIFEESVQLEYSIIKENNARRWSAKRKKKVRGLSFNLYAFAGIGAIQFYPYGTYNGTDYALRPLGTEGQNVAASGKKQYSVVSACIPFGMGVKFGINRKWDFGVEYGFRYTFTDYIDDVGGAYYDNKAIIESNLSKGTDVAKASGFLADNHITDTKFTDNRGVYNDYYAKGDRVPYSKESGDAMSIRAGKAKDIYMFLVFNLSYKLRTGRNGLPKFN